jgi:hypothetical protein
MSPGIPSSLIRVLAFRPSRSGELRVYTDVSPSFHIAPRYIRGIGASGSFRNVNGFRRSRSSGMAKTRLSPK